jgi:hypothetical protein
MDLLAGLHHQQGNLDRAIEILRQSAELCRKHKIEFDGKDMLLEYQSEKRNRSKKSRFG